MSSVPVTTPRISKQIAQESHPPVVTAGLHEGNGHALELAKAFYELTPPLDLNLFFKNYVHVCVSVWVHTCEYQLRSHAAGVVAA